MARLHYASTKDPDMLYLVQHRITDPFFFLEHEGVKRIFLSSVDIDAFRADSSGAVEAVDAGPLRSEATKKEGNFAGNLAITILDKYDGVKDVLVPPTFPVSIADVLRDHNYKVIVEKNWCSERECKSSEEIAFIKENFEHTKKAFELVEKILTESKIEGLAIMYDSKPLTSEFLKREISKLLLDNDLENIAGLIVSCGEHAAMPHHEGAGPLRPHQTIIVDIFPQSTQNYYFADMTRTYVKGAASEDIIKMYKAVQEAQETTLTALRPGVTGKEVYEISAESIRNSEFDVGDQGYVHGLGHGIGVDVHECPRLSAHSKEVLKVGHVVTIEPGLYYKELGGVRIEDTVVITNDGYENLTNYPKNWLIS